MSIAKNIIEDIVIKAGRKKEEFFGDKELSNFLDELCPLVQTKRFGKFLIFYIFMEPYIKKPLID